VNTTTSNELMRIKGNGNVGIGTSSPSAKLDVQGTSGATIKIVDGNQASGKVLTSDANGNASWQNVSKPHGSQMYTTPGTYTFVVPGGASSVRLTIVGAGGGGGGRGPGASGGNGGAAGSYVRDTVISVTPGASITVIVGSGGGGGADGMSASAGGTGGASSFGVISRNGGAGGCASCVFGSQSPSGASGLFGTGGVGGNTNGSCRAEGTGFGAGGGGGAWTCGTGNGAPGLVFIEYWIW
jgi:hypothetical protein